MGYHFFLQGILLTQGSNPHLASPALTGGFFTYCATWETPNLSYLKLNKFSSSVALDTSQVLDSHTCIIWDSTQIENISIFTESLLNSTFLDCFSEDTSC